MMYTSRNPAKSRPLSANVKRLMRLARASPHNEKVVKVGRQFSIRDLACCGKQGSMFMEAASMGFPMDDFAPLFMTSQIAGIFDVYFSTSNGDGSGGLFDLLQIPMLLKNPATVVEALYWIDDIIERAEEGENKSLLVSRAYDAETLKLPPTLENLPEEPNRNTDDLAYAYWLGYIYRCECLMHEESSRMVYGAFTEDIMRSAYRRLLDSPMGQQDLVENAVGICEELDRFLVEKLWPEKKKQERRKQEMEMRRDHRSRDEPAQDDNCGV
jgi:hypothetical protein